MTNTLNTPPIAPSHGPILAKIYGASVLIIAILTIVFGICDPWLISQKDDFLVSAGFVLAAVTLPGLFYLAVTIVRNLKKLNGE